jgi:glycosyltransferase involved in cell wall biosynthesis
MKILHLTPSIGRGSYGLGQVALNLVKAQVALGHDSIIWCVDQPDESRRAAEGIDLSPDLIRSFPSIGPASLGLSPALYRAAMEYGANFELVHQHGIWTPISYMTKLLAAQYGVQSVIAPHGSLEKGVVRKSLWKKRIASWAYESDNLNNAACLHATAPGEIQDFRDYGLRGPIALIPNGISDTWLAEKGDAARFRAVTGIPQGSRVVLFMSRIAPKKGLPMLLNAWSRLGAATLGWLLVIVGGDEDGHRAEVQLLANRLGLDGRVRFVGPRFGQEKRDALAAAELLVLPSLSEGFPIVVLDALGAGVPAVVTRASAWQDLETKGCGWWVETSIEGLERGLSAALGLPPSHLREMGAAGRRLVSSRYNWATLAGKTLELYRWLLRLENQPTFVSIT